MNLVPVTTVCLTGGKSSSSCGNPDDNRAQAGFLIPMAAPALTARYGKGTDSDATDSLIVADTLRSHPRPGSNSNGAIVAYPLAMRGRADGAELEMGEEGVYNALRAGDGGSSRQNLVAYSTKMHNTKSNQAGKFYEEYTPGLQADSPPPVVAYQCHGGSVGPMGTLRTGVPFLTEDYAMAVRRLLPLECERLMGLPDGHTAGASDSARYRMLGNSVVVPVVEWIARRMVAVDAQPHPQPQVEALASPPGGA